MDETLKQIRDLEKLLEAGAWHEDMLNRFLRRGADPAQRRVVERKLVVLGLQLDRLQADIKRLAWAREKRIRNEERVRSMALPARRPVKFKKIEVAGI